MAPSENHLPRKSEDLFDSQNIKQQQQQPQKAHYPHKDLGMAVHACDLSEVEI